MNPAIIGAAFAAGFVCGVVTASLWRRAKREREAWAKWYRERRRR